MDVHKLIELVGVKVKDEDRSKRCQIAWELTSPNMLSVRLRKRGERGREKPSVAFVLRYVDKKWVKPDGPGRSSAATRALAQEVFGDKVSFDSLVTEVQEWAMSNSAITALSRAAVELLNLKHHLNNRWGDLQAAIREVEDVSNKYRELEAELSAKMTAFAANMEPG
jgi:hypothetical protein